jgi:tetratricopeptide (TPR) repeat protein
MSPRPLAAALALVLLTASAPARAGEGAVPDPVALAKERFRKGVELYRTQRFREAAAEFEAAYRLKPHGAIHYNVAQCRERLGEWPGALRSYVDYLREVPDAKDRAAVRASMQRLEERLEAAGVQALLVYSDPLGAEVRVDGKPRGRTPFHTVLAPGGYALAVSLDGHAIAEREVTLSRGSALVVDVTLSVAADLAARPGALATGSRPALPAASKAPAAVKPRGRVWTWVAASASAAALAAGAYYGVTARRRSDELRDGTARAASANEALREDAEQAARRANVLYGIAGAAGAAGATLFFVEGRF